MKTTDQKRDELWDFLLEEGIATESELVLVTTLNGFNLEALEGILFAVEGYRSLEQMQDLDLV